MDSKSIRADKKERLQSLDVLRGFDMFWITGGGLLFGWVGKTCGIDWLAMQMDHAQWAGFHFFDLIFPLFMFISGVAIPYAIISKLEKNIPKKSLVTKAFKRMIILVFLGFIYNGVLEGKPEEIRFASVLGQIGIAYFLTSLIIIYSSSFKTKLYWLAGILLGYSVAQLFIPVPGVGAGVFTPEGCINGFIDRHLLPGHLYGKVFDPEGLMSIISATGITLMGTVAGHYLRDRKRSDKQKIVRLAIIGVILVILALIINPFYPIIKSCWTTTFNLMAGGLSFLLIALFFLVIDVMKWRKWAFYFRVIGMNSIFIYLFARLFGAYNSSFLLFGWTMQIWGEAARFVIYLGILSINWGILYLMYKKEIFVRV